MTVLDKLRALLDARGVQYDVTQHAPVFTSEEAARVRGTPLASGAKALICKAGERFVMFVMPADRRLDNKAVRKSLAIKGTRFATREEVLELTTLVPGSIPPFGSVFGLQTYCDARLADQPRINFNAGDHAVSFSMNCADYIAVEVPTLGAYTSEA